MRIGTLRGVTLALALVSAVLSGHSALANDPFHHTIPTEVDAVDVNTGGPYFAPPVPYGHYNKDSHLSKLLGLPSGLFHSVAGKLHGNGDGLCSNCGGKGCGACGGSGLLSGLGHGHGGFGHGNDGDCGPGCGLGLGKVFRFKNCGLCKGKGCGVCTTDILASSQAPVAAPSGQSVVNGGGHGHGLGNGCGIKGCGLGFGHKHGGLGLGNALGCLHGAGAKCGLCAGLGNGHGNGNGSGCNACGGRGCGLCGGGGGGLLSKCKGLAYGLLHPHAGKIEYFMGPGGPVPLTPGYTPYVVTTRSPRDYFAFPPFTPDR